MEVTVRAGLRQICQCRSGLVVLRRARGP